MALNGLLLSILLIDASNIPLFKDSPVISICGAVETSTDDIFTPACLLWSDIDHLTDTTFDAALIGVVGVNVYIVLPADVGSVNLCNTLVGLALSDTSYNSSVPGSASLRVTLNPSLVFTTDSILDTSSGNSLAYIAAFFVGLNDNMSSIKTGSLPFGHSILAIAP